jgi:hypothetical protein
MSFDIATSKPILRPTAPVYQYVFSAGDTDTIDFINELDRLLTLENRDGYIFQASAYAYENAKRYIELCGAFFGGLFPQPEFVPDGEAGIDIEWANKNRRITISCRGNNAQNDYIYWQEGDRYDAVDITLSRLINSLNWLNGA